jgi:hypothetical protein
MAISGAKDTIMADAVFFKLPMRASRCHSAFRMATNRRNAAAKTLKCVKPIWSESSQP